MSQSSHRPPQLGATFTPGGFDDFYMPEVISPAPQRVTPEVPEKIQDGIAHLELEAAPSNRHSALQSPPPIDGKQGSIPPALPSRNSSVSNLSVANEQIHNQGQGIQSPIQASTLANQYAEIIDQPSFSPFPPLRNRPANVPPSDEEKEGILESARTPVLTSDDPEMQLSWAQDTLAWVEIASQNEARSSESQGARAQTPHIEHQLRVDAISIVTFLADQNHPKAVFMKGMWLEFGKFGIRMDKKEAFRCYQRSALRGYSRAEYRMGMQFESSNEPDKAIKHYTLGVQAGDSASHYRLGMMTLLGQHGQPMDHEKGIKLVSYAAQTADENAPQGAYVYGMLLAHELPQINLPERLLPLNISAARFNIEHAAYLGFAKAQTKMGAAYELCQLGCDFDPALSLHYNALAAKQGEPEADMAISKWFLCGYEGTFEKSEELAFTYAQRAAQSGLATAEFALGYFYEIGIYVQADLQRSRSWYEKAAEHGNRDAVVRIDGISRSKTLSRKDHDNVAVAKIKSQYGSHKGKRPERFKNPSEPMPTIADSPVDMPEPSIPKPRPGQSQPYAYRNTNAPGARPPSSAPYPQDDIRGRPPPRSANGSSYSNSTPSVQPSARPPSATQSESSFGDNNFRGSGYPTFQSPRPGSGPQQQVPGRGRGALGYGAEHAGAGRGRGGPGYGPVNGPGGPGYRQPSSGQASPQVPGSPTFNGSRPTSAQPPAIDIGFSAPPDPSGADRKWRQQRHDAANMSSQGGMPPPGQRPSAGRLSSYDGSGRQQDRLSNLPHSQTMPNNRAPSPSRRPVTSGGRPGVTLHDPPSRPDSAATLPNLPPPKLPNADRPSGTPPPNVPAARPFGKGPKTFQEMGVPATKQESDCVVM
ncbi:hypothetical protein ACLMJK_000306 [Lecanora helva]